MLTAIVLGLVVLVRVPAAAADPGDDGPCLAPPPAAEVPAEAEPLAVAAAELEEDYDPWQPFNERMFWFNHGVLDRFLVKPTARGWSKVLPGVARRRLDHAFDNLEMPRRLVNNLLQLRPLGAGQELARFVLNTTVGVIGLFDVAGRLHIEPSDADAGQTLGIYGIGAGPYLVLPFLPPLTVRDGIGSVFDGLLDPFGHFLPFIANQTMGVVKQVNERSLNLELYEEAEDAMLDVYSAARNAYLQRRRHEVEQRRAGDG